ncbi:UbiA family prenyltransferase [Candidatus Alkanophaga liquidiphilum]
MRWLELRGWWELAGLPKFATTLVPFTLGAVVAWTEGHVDIITFATSLVALFLMTAFCFVLNACSVYSDLKSRGVRLGSRGHGLSDFFSTAASGRFDALVSEKISVEKAMAGAYICGVLSIPLVLVLHFWLRTGQLTLALGIFGLFLMFSYSRGPKFSYHGLGEVALAFGVGWFTVFSGYYLQTHESSLKPTLVALPFMIEAFKLKLLRELPDIRLDSLINRRTLAVRLGKEKIIRACTPLTLLAWLSFLFLLPLDVRPFSLVVLAIPGYFTLRSLLSIKRGLWRTDEGLEQICKDAFTGMMLIPLALIGVFVLSVCAG